MLKKAVKIIEQIQWSHCGAECAACGAPYSSTAENSGHEYWCPIVLLFDELGIPKSRLQREEEPIPEMTGPPITIQAADEILRRMYKDAKSKL